MSYQKKINYNQLLEGKSNYQAIFAEKSEKTINMTKILT